MNIWKESPGRLSISASLCQAVMSSGVILHEEKSDLCFHEASMDIWEVFKGMQKGLIFAGCVLEWIRYLRG